MEGTQTLSARTLLGLPWALKPIFALFIHCSPLPRGFRLRSAMTIGWGATASALIAIFFRDQPTPYFQDRKMVGTPLSDLSTQQMNSINLDAPAHGAFYVMLMCVASVGFVLADVAADELIRDVAVHHFGVSASPRDEDEVFQPVMTKYRVIATLGCFLFMGFGMSGWDYGGDFDFSLEYTQVMLVVGLVSLLPVVLLGFTVSETARDRRSLRQSLREIWSLVHNCGLNHVLLCRFVGGVCAGVSATAVNPIAFYYAGVQPLNDTVVSFVAIIVVLWALNWVGKKDWNVDYRTVIVVGTIITLVLDCGATMFTIWGVVRSQWFWIGLPVMEAIPSALDYTISTVVLTEIADARAYSSMSALVTSVSFVAGPLGLALSKYMDAQFDVTNQDIMTDTTHVRDHIMATFFIAYALQLISLMWLLALPKNSSEAEALRIRGDTSTIGGVGLLTLLGLSLAVVVTVHGLSVYEPTACLGVSGGRGC
ncbi:outer membrane protein PmpB [Phytophthora cinnamomi]|uniref:outer membrane protein PmpB n=1 Tax=Phytophthora cinnamomi TaxID=4785 RepID=UPI00355AB9DD|nr:outer membrane protein PmpB [Phytophthora cinnamomi]